MPKGDTQATRSLAGHRVEVAIVEPSRGALRLAVPGEVEGDRDAFLAAPLGGYIERVLVEEGDRVKRGQILVNVDRATHAARQERARVELASAERELKRTQALAGTIPQADIDAAEDRVKLAKATLHELELNASRAIVSAPFSGSIVKVNAEVGEVAAPGTPLVRLVKLDPARVTIALSDRDISLAKVGAKARVYLDARSGVYEGTVTSIASAADLKTRSFEAVIEVQNEREELLPGMIANVELDSKDDADAPPGAPTKLVISQDWLVTKPDGVGLFVVEAGKAVWRSVELGDVLRKQVVVKSGLSAGDALIIVGHRDLVAGDQVLIHRQGVCCVGGRATFSE